MPIYDYRCTACAHEVEVIHGIDAPGPATCDVCGGVMRKALSTPAIHFKGSGWAKKDAQAASKAKTTKAATPKTDGKEKSPASTEAKPASTDGSSTASSSDGGGAGTTGAAKSASSSTTD